jgi:VanZ family protein
MRTLGSAKLLIVSAWVVVTFIAYATLTRAGFVYAIYYELAPVLFRPDMKTYAHFEHVIAFAFLGAVFCFAYPRRLFLICSVVFGSAVILEFLQTLTPDRHGTLVDAIEKLAGGAAGVIFARIILAIFRKRAAQKN